MRLFRIPVALRSKKYLMEEFKQWCVSKSYDVSDCQNLTIKKPNGSTGISFKNSQCNKEFLSICRDFLINEKNHKIFTCNRG